MLYIRINVAIDHPFDPLGYVSCRRCVMPPFSIALCHAAVERNDAYPTTMLLENVIRFPVMQKVCRICLRECAISVLRPTFEAQIQRKILQLWFVGENYAPCKILYAMGAQIFRENRI